MADIYVRSTDGSDADNGSTWALAKQSLTGFAAIDAAGDVAYLSQSHNYQPGGSNRTLAFAGTPSNPVKLICVNDSAEPPTTVTTGAIEGVFGNLAIAFTGSFIAYGIEFGIYAGSAGLNIGFGSDQSVQSLVGCTLKFTNTATCRIVLGANATKGVEVFFKASNLSLYFGHVSQGFQLNDTTASISGGSILSGSSAITEFVKQAQGTIKFNVSDFDFSNAATGLNLVYSGIPATGSITFLNCKLPSSWSGGLVAGSPTLPGMRISMYNCDSAATNYRLWIETYSGAIISETTIVKTGGASDGTTALSWKMTSNANANEHTSPLVSDDMAVWIDSVGTSKTITVDILHDSVTALTDAEVWLEIDYLGSSSSSLGTPTSDKRTTVLTSPANQTTSTATWTTTGITNPNKQKLEVTFTPQMKGFVYARVCLAKPGSIYTIYVDYEPTVT